MGRIDKREFDQLRKIKFNRGFIKYADGSCLVEMGDTKVICTATFDNGVPFFLRNSGKGWVSAQYRMLPRCAQIRIPRDKISGRIMEIQRLIGRSLRSIINTNRLGEKTILLDCDVIQADGGTRTASIIGSYIALADCLNNLYKKDTIKEIPLTDFVAAISVGLYKGKPILDLNFREDSDAEVDMNVVMKSCGEFVEVQGTAEKGSFSKKDMDSFLDLAKKGIDEIIAKQKEVLKDIPINLDF